MKIDKIHNQFKIIRIKEIILPQISTKSDETATKYLYQCLNDFISNNHLEGVILVSCTLRKVRQWDTFKVYIRISYDPNSDDVKFFEENVEEAILSI